MRKEWVLLMKNENVCLGWGRIGTMGKCQIGMREELLLLRKNSSVHVCKDWGRKGAHSMNVSQDKKWGRSSSFWGKKGTHMRNSTAKYQKVWKWDGCLDFKLKISSRIFTDNPNIFRFRLQFIQKSTPHTNYSMDWWFDPSYLVFLS